MNYEIHETPISDLRSGYPRGTGKVEIWRDSKVVIPVCKRTCRKCASGEHNEVEGR
jgi:protein tyrosine/serine phosphatase